MTKFHLITGVQPGTSIPFTFNGVAMTGHKDESIAAALLRAGHTAQRISGRDHTARGYYCGMGQCWECAVHVQGLNIVRSCMEPLKPDMVITTADKDLE